MTEPFTIMNGTHVDQPIGRLTAPDGHVILVWSGQPVELLGVMLEAIGPPPEPIAYGLGGSMEVSGQTTGGPWGEAMPTYSYNAAGDVINQAKAVEFTALVSAYNARVAAVQAVILAMVQSKKE